MYGACQKELAFVTDRRLWVRELEGRRKGQKKGAKEPPFLLV